jgi:serine/threonine protein kinase
MQDDVLIGQRLGAYLIQTKLGEGGMARVYKAYHARLRREVAIKVILSQIAEQADFKVRFEREAQLVASLQHPNIVAVYDFGDYETMTYLVMQYVGGGTLRDLLRNGRALDPRTATLYTIQMGKALHHAHLRGIVHRDVKPQNMLVSASDQGQLLLSDFGIAKLYSSRLEPARPDQNDATAITALSDPSLTRVDQIVGTAEYMAPEQIHGHAVDARTDVYALGVVLFQMLTGEVPFHSTTVQGLLYQHVYTPPRNVQEYNPNVSETLARIVSKAMAKSPSDRFQSAEEMAQALEAANSNATYRLTNSMPPTAYNQPQGIDPLTLPSQQRPSFYGQPSQAGTPAPGMASAYGQYNQQPALGATPPPGTTGRVTSTGISGSAIPAGGRHARHIQPFSFVGIGLVILLALGLILVKTGALPFFSGGAGNSNNGAAQAFTETFHDNHLSWTIGSVSGLNASFGQSSYILDIPLATAANTYFPYPSGAGSLPDTFTWSAQMEQTKGSLAFYGLAFHLKQDSTGVSCYAFIINGQGNYQVLKYSAGSASPTILSQGQSTAIHNGLNAVNALQVRVQSNTFTLTVNNTPISTPNPITDNTGGTPYTGGAPALLVAGSAQSEVSYTVTQAQLTVG